MTWDEILDKAGVAVSGGDTERKWIEHRLALVTGQGNRAKKERSRLLAKLDVLDGKRLTT